jgi:arsenate reductase-like glutaredoxin family protein
LVALSKKPLGFARARLDRHGVAYVFHDYNSAGIERGAIAGWARAPRRSAC